jgi:hypothetical protein
MDDLDEFMGYDFTMGADVVKCPHCGADVPCSLFFDMPETFHTHVNTQYYTFDLLRPDAYEAWFSNMQRGITA